MAKIQITYFNFDQNSIQVSNFTFVNFLITPKKKKKKKSSIWVVGGTRMVGPLPRRLRGISPSPG